MNENATWQETASELSFHNKLFWIANVIGENRTEREGGNGSVEEA